MIINSRHSFYTSDLWNKCKQQVLFERVREDGCVYCEHCGQPIVKQFDPQKNDNRYSMIFHHKIELTDENYQDYNISLNPANIQIVHFKCHNEIHNRFTSGKPKRKIYLVVGAVCSGKTTFVKENITTGDIVLDLDLIWQALSLQPLHSKPTTIKPIVFSVRDTIMEQIKMRSGMWQNAWIITTQSRPLDIKRMADSLNAEVIYIDTDIDECKRRLNENPNGRDLQLYNKLIDEFFENRKFTE